MPNNQVIQNLYIPSDLDREFPLAPHFVQAFGSYPNYLHFNEDFKPSARELLDVRGFRLINHTSRVSDEGWHIIERVYEHDEGLLLKAEFVGERFFRLYGYYRDEASAKTLLDGFLEHKYVHEDNQTHIYLIQSGLGGLHTERVEILPPVIELDLNYNDDFPPVHDILVDLLSLPNRLGLFLLLCEPGTCITK